MYLSDFLTITIEELEQACARSGRLYTIYMPSEITFTINPKDFDEFNTNAEHTITFTIDVGRKNP